MCRVTRLTADLNAAWDDYVGSHEAATFFHTIAWRDAVRAGFGHEAVYLVALRGEHLVGILPMFLLSSRFTGRMLVSVPYGVGGGIVAGNAEAIALLFAGARHIAKQRDCVMIDLRSERACVPDVPTVDRYLGFRRALPASSSDVLGWLPRKARAAARNARNKYKLTVEFGDEHLREVWRLYAMSMRRLASLNYPFRFFERLVEFTPGRHWVSVVRRSGRIVAGLVTFLFKDRVMPYFIGTTRQATRCSAANYIYLTAMEHGVDLGYRVFDFGRTRRDNIGGCNFKRFQGFGPRPLGYQCFTLPERVAPNLSPSNPKLEIARKIWSYLPLTVTRAVGARLVRHIPG
jgi:FemAB-related protein (PEP-CTERM system-associated)